MKEKKKKLKKINPRNGKPQWFEKRARRKRRGTQSMAKFKPPSHGHEKPVRQFNQAWPPYKCCHQSNKA